VLGENPIIYQWTQAAADDYYMNIRPHRGPSAAPRGDERHRYVIVYLNDKGTHWISAVIDRRAKEIWCFDSLGGGRDQRFKCTVHALGRAYSRILGGSDWAIVQAEMTSQAGIWQCGYISALAGGSFVRFRESVVANFNVHYDLPGRDLLPTTEPLSLRGNITTNRWGDWYTVLIPTLGSDGVKLCGTLLTLDMLLLTWVRLTAWRDLGSIYLRPLCAVEPGPPDGSSWLYSGGEVFGRDEPAGVLALLTTTSPVPTPQTPARPPQLQGQRPSSDRGGSRSPSRPTPDDTNRSRQTPLPQLTTPAIVAEPPSGGSDRPVFSSPPGTREPGYGLAMDDKRPSSPRPSGREALLGRRLPLPSSDRMPSPRLPLPPRGSLSANTLESGSRDIANMSRRRPPMPAGNNNSSSPSGAPRDPGSRRVTGGITDRSRPTPSGNNGSSGRVRDNLPPPGSGRSNRSLSPQRSPPKRPTATIAAAMGRTTVPSPPSRVSGQQSGWTPTPLPDYLQTILNPSQQRDQARGQQQRRPPVDDEGEEKDPWSV
jgi:hypothetical protein